MEPRQSKRTRAGRSLALLAGLLALGAAGCGSSADTPPSGLSIAGPGLQTSRPAAGPAKPAWPPEDAHLAQRLKAIGIPPGGKEKFHIHVLLDIYVNGLLAPVPTGVGLDPAKHIESSMHTHDGSGIIHMEGPRPFKYTLGDFFAVWGVKLGPAQVGGLTGLGGNRLHFYVNGRTLRNPAAYVLHNGDSIVIGYGPASSFPHKPSTRALYEVEHGLGNLGCSSAHKGKKAKSCLAPQPASRPKASKG